VRIRNRVPRQHRKLAPANQVRGEVFVGKGDDYRGLRLLPAERSRMESVQNLEAEEALFGWIEGGPRLRR
jgi:hypothetical protein